MQKWVGQDGQTINGMRGNFSVEQLKRRGFPIHDRCGENNPNFRVSDDDAALMVRLREDHGMTPRQIRDKFDNYEPPLSLTTVKDILSGRRRGRIR